MYRLPHYCKEFDFAMISTDSEFDCCLCKPPLRPEKGFTQASVRKAVSATLKPLKEALTDPREDHEVFMPTDCELWGLTFTACRWYKSPGQIGYVWKPDYQGRDETGKIVVSGTISQISQALYWKWQRVRLAEEKQNKLDIKVSF